MEFPDGLKYSEEHLWVNKKDNTALLGITSFAAKELGEVVFVDLPQVGDLIDQNESFGTLESSKTISELFAPLSGKVIELNSDLEDDPSIISEYPYDDGWLVKIELTDNDELESLLSSDTYQAFIEEDDELEEDDDDDDDDDYE